MQCFIQTAWDNPPNNLKSPKTQQTIMLWSEYKSVRPLLNFKSPKSRGLDETLTVWTGSRGFVLDLHAMRILPVHRANWPNTGENEWVTATITADGLCNAKHIKRRQLMTSMFQDHHFIITIWCRLGHTSNPSGWSWNPIIHTQALKS